MKVIIAGSRGITGEEGFALVCQAVAASGFQITRVISGTALGVDKLGERWAKENSVPFDSFPARWRTRDGELNRNAGFERNARMAAVADALVAVWDGHSNGTKHMIRCMGRLAKPTYVLDLDL